MVLWEGLCPGLGELPCSQDVGAEATPWGGMLLTVHLPVLAPGRLNR